MYRPSGIRRIRDSVMRKAKKPLWYGVNKLTGIRLQMHTHYYDLSQIVACFPAPVDKVKASLPSSKLEPVECSPGMVGVLIIANEMRHIDILEPYNEIATGVYVRLPGTNTPEQQANYYFHMPVTTEDACWPGVENFGFPKFLVDVTFEDTPDTWCCHLSQDGQEIFTLEAQKLATDFEAWEVLNLTQRDGTFLICGFDVQGQRGLSEADGECTCRLGDHPMAQELRATGMSQTSIWHQYIPQAQAVLQKPKKVSI